MSKRDTAFEPYRIGVVIPTLDVRPKHYLKRALESHCPPWLETSGYVFSPSVQLNYPTCGEAWNYGVAHLLDSGAEFILLSADDLELIEPERFYAEAVETMQAGKLPAAQVTNTDGRPADLDGLPGEPVHFPRVPFLPREFAREVFPIPPLHEYSDVWLGDRAAELGWPVIALGSHFVHYWAQEGRQDDGQGEHDRKLYEQARGTWVAP